MMAGRSPPSIGIWLSQGTYKPASALPRGLTSLNLQRGSRACAAVPAGITGDAFVMDWRF
jgi:hypothetical protein